MAGFVGTAATGAPTIALWLYALPGIIQGIDKLIKTLVRALERVSELFQGLFRGNGKRKTTRGSRNGRLRTKVDNSVQHPRRGLSRRHNRRMNPSYPRPRGRTRAA